MKCRAGDPRDEVNRAWQCYQFHSIYQAADQG